jgi:hypothetical protein
MGKIRFKGGQVGRAKRSLCAIAVCATAVVGVSANAAFAGEITGSGKPTGNRPDFVTPLHANSACAYSGHNDDPGAPLDGSGPNGPGGQSQSYGQDVKLGLISPHEFNPASPGACNPNRLSP